MIQMKASSQMGAREARQEHQNGFPQKSVTNESYEMVDTRVLLDSVNIEGLDDILAIGTFGFDQLNLSNCKAKEEIALVVQCQETESGQETNMGIAKPTTDTCIAIANEVCLIDNEMLDDQLDSDDNNAMKKKKMTLADLFLADDPFFHNPDGSAALIQTKDGPSCSFVKKLPIPCITAGKNSSCLLYSRLPVRKLHRMMAKMLKKKKKIHPAAVQSNSEMADIESDIMGHKDVRTAE